MKLSVLAPLAMVLIDSGTSFLYISIRCHMTVYIWLSVECLPLLALVSSRHLDSNLECYVIYVVCGLGNGKVGLENRTFEIESPYFSFSLSLIFDV